MEIECCITYRGKSSFDIINRTYRLNLDNLIINKDDSNMVYLDNSSNGYVLESVFDKLDIKKHIKNKELVTNYLGSNKKKLRLLITAISDENYLMKLKIDNFMEKH